MTPLQRPERCQILRRTEFDNEQVNVTKNHPTEGKNFVDFENACRTDDGDGRVPRASSCVYYNSILTLMRKDSFWYRDYSHGFVLKDERAQKLTNRFLFGTGAFNYAIRGGSVKRVEGPSNKNRRRVESRLPRGGSLITKREEPIRKSSGRVEGWRNRTCQSDFDRSTTWGHPSSGP